MYRLSCPDLPGPSYPVSTIRKGWDKKWPKKAAFSDPDIMINSGFVDEEGATYKVGTEVTPFSTSDHQNRTNGMPERRTSKEKQV